jgi:hypothetical protein
MERKAKRSTIILVAGFAAIMIAQYIINHPYFALMVWPEPTISKYKRNGENSFLLRIAQSRFFPRDTRYEALRAAVYLQTFGEQPVFMCNRKIERLAQFFDEDIWSLTGYCFHQPFVDGEVNPSLVSMVLDPGLTEYTRIVAFSQIIVGKDLSQTEAKKIHKLWSQIDSKQVRTRIANAITYTSPCGNPDLPSNLVQEFTKDRQGQQTP